LLQAVAVAVAVAVAAAADLPLRPNRNNLAACVAGKRTFNNRLTIFCRQHTSSPHIHYLMRSLVGFNRINLRINQILATDPAPLSAMPGQAHTDIHRQNIIVKDLRDLRIALSWIWSLPNDTKNEKQISACLRMDGIRACR
jgi:hypothetical protein